jgi:hypothetical protein
LADFAGEFRSGLIACEVMISDLLTLGIWWHVIQTYPGLLDALGYFYGIVAASFTLEAMETYLQTRTK